MQYLCFLSHLYIIRHNNSCVSIVFGIQLQQNLCRSPVPSLWVCLCVSVTEGRGRNKHTCSSWQIKMNSVVLGSGSLFIIFHFTQRASQTSAAACHVKTLYQVLTAPPMHTHRMHGSYTLWLCSRPLPLTLLHMQGAYVAIYLTSTPSCTALSTLCLSPPLLFSHFSSGGKSVFLFFGLSPPLKLVKFSHLFAVTFDLYRSGFHSGTRCFEWDFLSEARVSA